MIKRLTTSTFDTNLSSVFEPGFTVTTFALPPSTSNSDLTFFSTTQYSPASTIFEVAIPSLLVVTVKSVLLVSAILRSSSIFVLNLGKYSNVIFPAGLAIVSSILNEVFVIVNLPLGTFATISLLS